MSKTRIVVTVVLLAINALIGTYLWTMAGQLISSPANYKVGVGLGLYLFVAIWAGVIVGKLFKEFAKLKGESNAKV